MCPPWIEGTHAGAPPLPGIASKPDVTALRGNQRGWCHVPLIIWNIIIDIYSAPFLFAFAVPFPDPRHDVFEYTKNPQNLQSAWGVCPSNQFPLEKSPSL
jgi:hypothetical protein